MQETKDKVRAQEEAIDMSAELEEFERTGQLSQEQLQNYWKENRNLVLTLLAIWAASSFLLQALASVLNNVVILGFPFAYYMGGQGTLIIFMLLIYVYAKKMDELDRKYNLQEEEEEK
jgi:putative solute:sodium symporter small subunit